MPHNTGSGRKQGRRTRQAQQRASAPTPAAARPMRGDPGELLLHLQRTVGNQAVNALLRQQRAAGNRDMPAVALVGRPYAGEIALPPGARPGAMQLTTTLPPAVAWSPPLQRDAGSTVALAVGPVIAGTGPVIARQFDPAAGHGDDHVNPESIVHDLRRFIDQKQATIDDRPPPDHAFSVGMRFVRKVDASGVIRVLDNLTAAQVATVKRLYAEQEGRPLEKDLFEGGESGIPSSLTADQRARIKALLQGTRAEGEGPGGPTDARLEADAVELHDLLQGDLDEPKRERIMAMHRRPVAEITGLDNAYARLYGRELSVELGNRLTGLQRNRMAELRDGNWALADACAIEDKRRALDELAARPIDPFHPEAREKERARLVAGIEGIVAMNSQEALNDPANAGKSAAQAVQERIAAILRTPAGDPWQSLGDALAKTLGPDAGGPIAAMARGAPVAELAARRLLEMEANHTTKTEKIVELLHGLRAQAGHDVLARVQDPSLPTQEKEQIAAHPEAAVDALARQYTASFRDTYNSLRGEGRSYEAILESAHSYDEDMLRALTEGGGQMSPVVELDHAIRKGDVEAIKAVLQRQRTKSAIDDLVRQYEAMPGHGEGSLRRALFGLFGAGNADLAMAMDSHMLGHGLLTGRDALLAEEALRKPAQLGGADEVDWLASYGRREAAVAEANSGIVGSLREIGGDPETQALMDESAARLRALQAEWTQHDPWGRPRQEILAEMRRWRATLTGDATAYEEENTRLVAEIRSAVSFAVQVALAVALPGIGGGFLATTALNIGATVASNMVIYGDQYSLESFRNDVLGGVLGAAGGKLGEELAAGAVAGKAASSAEAAEAIASRVAGDAAAPAAEAAERAGVSTGLLRQGEEASALAARGSLALAAARQGGNLVGSTAGTTIATGQNGFTLEGLAKGAFLGMLGKMAGPREAAVEHEGTPASPDMQSVATGGSPSRDRQASVASEHPAGVAATASRDAPTRIGEPVPAHAPRAPQDIPLIDLPEGSIMYGGERPLSAAEAQTMYENAIADSPQREVMIYENVETGERIVVQGDESMVGASPDTWREFVSERMGGGRWRGVRHSHAIDPTTRVTPLEKRFPSGAGGDLAAAEQDAVASGRPHAESFDIVTERGAEEVRYGCDPHAERPYWIDYPHAGGRVREAFRSMEAYHSWYETMTGRAMGVVGDAGPVGGEAPRRRAVPPKSKDSPESEEPSGSKEPPTEGEPSEPARPLSVDEVRNLVQSLQGRVRIIADRARRAGRGDLRIEAERLRKTADELHMVANSSSSDDIQGLVAPEAREVESRLNDIEHQLPPEETPLRPYPEELAQWEGRKVQDEEGNWSDSSHTMREHGPTVTDESLQAQARKNEGGRAARFLDGDTMQDVILRAIAADRAAIEEWLARPPAAGELLPLSRFNAGRGNLGHGFEFNRETEIYRKMPPPLLEAVQAVLMADGQGGYILYTAYPAPSL